MHARMAEVQQGNMTLSLLVSKQHVRWEPVWPSVVVTAQNTSGSTLLASHFPGAAVPLRKGPVEASLAGPACWSRGPCHTVCKQ